MQTTRTGIDAFIRRQLIIAAGLASSGMVIALAGLITTV